MTRRIRILVICAALFLGALTLACEMPDNVNVDVCTNNGTERACRTIRMPRSECIQKYGESVCH